MLNIDLTQYNPVQSDSQFANVPLPSAHLVVIEDSEIKDSVDQVTGFNKGKNLVLALTILKSSNGNEFIGEKIPLYIPLEGKPEAVQAGHKRISTLAYTLGIQGYLQDKEQLHGIQFIVVLDKNKDNNFPKFTRILNTQGLEIADANGNFKDHTIKDQQLIVELEKLKDAMANTQATAEAPSTANATAQAPQQQWQQPPQAQQAPNFVPQQNFGAPQQASTPPTGFTQAPSAPQGDNMPNWGNTVNQQNGQ